MLRVTEVLRLAGLTGDIDRIPQYALRRGAAVHKACELDDLGSLDEESVDEVVRPYLDAWRQWNSDHCTTPMLIERQVASEANGYCGTLDRVMLVREAEYLIDIKCGAVCHAWHPIQTVAYAIALGRPRINRACVHLNRDGEYKFNIHAKHDADAAIWFAALAKAKQMTKEVCDE
jgi:hypothetical protein